MKLHTEKTETLHKELLKEYKSNLVEVEKDNQESFARTFLHNAIYLHNLWFEQLKGVEVEEQKAPTLIAILERRDSDLSTFQKWMGDFANEAKPHGWAIWGWSYSLKTFVGFPIKGHTDEIPIGVLPLIVIDCWEHAYQLDYGTKFDEYIAKFWKDLSWDVINIRHEELMSYLGFDIK